MILPPGQYGAPSYDDMGEGLAVVLYVVVWLVFLGIPITAMILLPLLGLP
jgi:hypothetical protein